MSSTRRMRRMDRANKKTPGLQLTSLMDVFTILVFFLLVNSASSNVVEPPKDIKLPDSVVETVPNETVVIMVGPENILVQGEKVADTLQAIESKEPIIAEIVATLNDQKNRVIGVATETAVKSKEVTVLGDKTIPFKLLKKVMGSATAAGYSKISLAVIQKAGQTVDNQ